MKPETSAAPSPRLPPLTSAIFLVVGVPCIASLLRTPLHSAASRHGRPSTVESRHPRFLETRSVVVVGDDVDHDRDLVRLEPAAAELSHLLPQLIRLLGVQQGELCGHDLPGD